MGRLMVFIAHLRTCFGKGNEDERAACPCPPACEALCDQTRFDALRSPRGERHQGKERPFLVMPLDILRELQRRSPEPISDGALVTYLHLCGETRPECRWVLKTTAELADARDKAVETIREHLGVLERVGLILRVPMRELSYDHNMNEKATLVCDLPAWHQTPRDFAKLEDQRFAEEHEDALARIDRELALCRKSARRSRHVRRRVDLLKIKRQRLELVEARR